MTKLPQGNRESGWSLVRFPPGSHPEVQAKAGRDRKRSSKTVDESLEHCQLCQYPPACSRSGGFVVRRAPALIHFAPIRRRPPIALSGPADISGAQGTSAPRICQPGVVVPTGQWPFHQTARLGFHAVAHLLIGAEHGRLLCRRMRPRNKVIQFLWPQPIQRHQLDGIAPAIRSVGVSQRIQQSQDLHIADCGNRAALCLCASPTSLWSTRIKLNPGQGQCHRRCGGASLTGEDIAAMGELKLERQTSEPPLPPRIRCGNSRGWRDSNPRPTV